MKIISWYSIANESGTNVVSIGTPGMKTNVDEQILTGGFQALQQMLGSELGKNESRFLGGGDTTKIGRFRTKQGETEVIAQFLLMTMDNSPVPAILLEFSEPFIVELTNRLLSSGKLLEAQNKCLALSASDVYEEFIESLSQVRKNFKLPLSDSVFEDAMAELFKHCLNNYQDYDTLVELSEYNGTYHEAIQYLMKEKNQLIEGFAHELLEGLLDSDPLAIILYKKPSELQKITLRLLDNYMGSILPQTAVSLTKIGEMVFKDDVKEILQPIEPANLRSSRNRIQASLETVTFKKMIKNHPLIVLINPKLEVPNKEYQDIISDMVQRIFDEFDLGNVFANAIEEIYKDEPVESQKLAGEFFREFSLHFPVGMPDSAWKFLSFVLKKIELEKDRSTADIIQQMNISESHKTNINQKFQEQNKKYHLNRKDVKETKPVPTFEIGLECTEEDYFEFSEALRSTTCTLFQMFFDDIIWNAETNKCGLFPEVVASYSEEFLVSCQTLYTFVQMYNLVCDRFRTIMSDEIFPPIAQFFATTDTNILKLPVKDRMLYFGTPEHAIDVIIHYSSEKLSDDLKGFFKFCADLSDKMKEIKAAFINYKTAIETKLINAKPIDGKVMKFDFAALGRLKRFNDQSASLESEFKQITDCLQATASELHSAAAEFADNKKNDKNFKKQLEKSENDFNKRLQRYEKTLNDSKTRTADDIANLKQRLEKEQQRALKELQKIYASMSHPAFRIQLTNKGIKLTNRTELLSHIALGAKEKVDYDVFRLNRLIADYASFFLYKRVRTKTLNKAWELALYKTAESDTISIAFQEAKRDLSLSAGNFRFLEIFKERYHQLCQEKVANLLLYINDELRTSYFVKELPSSVVTYNSKKMRTLDIGILSDKFPLITGKIGDEVYVIKVGDGYQLHYHVPIVNSIKDADVQINKLIRYYSWNTYVVGKYRVFLDLMRFATQTLGRGVEFDDLISFLKSMSES